MFPLWFVIEEKGTGKRFLKLKSINITIHKFLLDFEAACFHLLSTWVVHDSKIIKNVKLCLLYTAVKNLKKKKYSAVMHEITILVSVLIRIVLTIHLRGNVFTFQS